MGTDILDSTFRYRTRNQDVRPPKPPSDSTRFSDPEAVWNICCGRQQSDRSHPKLFLDKLKKYKAKSASGKPVEASPELQKELASELARVSRIYGGGEGIDMSKFPEFTFPEPKVDPINMQ